MPYIYFIKFCHILKNHIVWTNCPYITIINFIEGLYPITINKLKSCIITSNKIEVRFGGLQNLEPLEICFFTKRLLFKNSISIIFFSTFISNEAHLAILRWAAQKFWKILSKIIKLWKRVTKLLNIIVLLYTFIYWVCKC